MHERGRLVSSTVEPEWDETEQGWMTALGLYRQTRCKQCGGDLLVTTDSKNEDKFRHKPPLQCFRCLAFARSYKAYDDQPHPQSLLHLVPHTPNGR